MNRSLRVAVFTREFPALSETFVLDHITGLIDLGHDVAVFAKKPRADPAVHPDVTRYSLMQRCRHLAVQGGSRSRPRTASNAIMSARLRTLPPLLRCLRQHGYRPDATRLRVKEAFFWTSMLTRERPYDILHCHFGQRGREVAQLRQLGATRGRLVTTFHGYDLSHVVKQDPAAYNFLFEQGDMFLTVSDYFRRRAIQLGAPEDRVHVHRVGVDLRQLRFRARALAPAETPRLLIIGRLIEKKGTSFALEAIAEAAKEHGSVACDIVGDGVLRGALEQRSDALGLSRHVVFHGSLCRDQVIELLDKAHVLLAPSVTSSDGDEEGIPTVLMEAMACGLPVVSTLHSGIPELVEDGVSGFLVPEKDVRALRNALLALLRSPEQWTAMGSAGRVKVEIDHDIEKQNRRLVAHYQRLVER